MLRSLVSITRSQKDNQDNYEVLKDISFNIANGERVGIIGKNKAGKTTLLQILTGITEPSSGELRVEGNIIPIFAQAHLLGPDPTGREYIYLHGAALGISKKEVTRHIEEIIDFSEITTIDTPVKFYSTGMRSRLALSVALHLPADIIVLDEVFSGSDIFFKEKVVAYLMNKLANSNITLVMISHNEQTLRSLCNRGILIDNGLVLKDGNINEVLDFYNHYYTSEN